MDGRLLVALVLLLLFVGAMAWAWHEADKAEARDGIEL